VPRNLALIHTVTTLVPVFEDLVKRILPEWKPFNIVDESLLRNTIQDNELTPLTTRRLMGYVWSAVDAGADAIVVTCSSLGSAVDAAKVTCPVPLFRIDEGMARMALKLGKRIGVLATLTTTLQPTAALIRSHAEASGASPIVLARLCKGAFDLLSSGDKEGHDNVVVQELANIEKDVDVIVLAQASMARVIGSMLEKPRVPVLSSPELGITHLKGILQSRRAT
jgi:Asp/Glu/hydantoin racemase